MKYEDLSTDEKLALVKEHGLENTEILELLKVAAALTDKRHDQTRLQERFLIVFDLYMKLRKV